MCTHSIGQTMAAHVHFAPLVSDRWQVVTQLSRVYVDQNMKNTRFFLARKFCSQRPDSTSQTLSLSTAAKEPSVSLGSAVQSHLCLPAPWPSGET